MVIAALQSFCFLFLIKQEPVGYNVSNDNVDEARKLLKRVYMQEKLSDEEFNEKIDEQLQGLSRSTSKEASLVTFKQAVFGAKYRKATWVCCLLNVFNQQSGIGMVSMFATRMLILIHE